MTRPLMLFMPVLTLAFYGACSSETVGKGTTATGGQGGDLSNSGGSDSETGGDGNMGGASGGTGGKDGTGGKTGSGGRDATVGCDSGTLDCNGDPTDGCETEASTVSTPAAVQILRPIRGAYTGSVHAAESKNTLRPTLTWSDSTSECGAIAYEVQMDDSCVAGDLDKCAFDSAEEEGATDTASYTPSDDLPVSMTAPVGALYTWRVRACDQANNCSDWSIPAPLHVGRTLQDINGDGYAESLLRTNLGNELYLGGVNFNGVADARLPASNGARFVGDLNADGFGDLAVMEGATVDCGPAGYMARIYYGGVDPTSLSTGLLCRSAGTPSVTNWPRDLGDLNGDGFDDLGVSWTFGSSENGLLVFLGGTTIAAEPIVEPQTKQEPYVTDLLEQNVSGRGDFDGDGYADIVMGTKRIMTSNEFYLLKGGPSLSSSFDDTLVIDNCDALTWLQMAGDVDDDGKDDWAVTCTDAEVNSAFFLLRGGAGLSTAVSDEWLSEDFEFKSVSPFIDFDNDGTGEFLIGIETGNPIIWRLNAADAASPPRYTRAFVGKRTDSADHNGDGRTDLVFGGTSSGVRAGASSSFNVPTVTLLAPGDTSSNYGIQF